jgi:hypothetical protein
MPVSLHIGDPRLRNVECISVLVGGQAETLGLRRPITTKLVGVGVPQVVGIREDACVRWFGMRCQVA